MTILAATLLIFQFTNLDIIVQQWLFDADAGWIVNKNAPLSRLIFYTGIKRLYILAILGFLAYCVICHSSSFVQTRIRGITIFILSTILVPVLIGIIKARSNVACPSQLLEFDGGTPYAHLFGSTIKEYLYPKFRCFPAGHASGGFALLSSYFLVHSEKSRRIVILGSLATGWTLGIYKMMIGDHFLSHTIVSMLVSCLIIFFIVRIVDFFSIGERNLSYGIADLGKQKATAVVYSDVVY